MDQYCVVLCGLRAGASDEIAAWQPVAAALKLDYIEFERRVVAALPRIVRQGLDQATAERITQVLQALQVDARVLPDDPQLAYIERAGVSCGPLPQSSLGDFIQPGESYRLRGATTWRPWPEPADLESVTPAVGFGGVDDVTQPTPVSAEPLTDMSPPPPTSITDEAREPLADELPAGVDDAPEHATPSSPSADAVDLRSNFAQEEEAAGDAELFRAMPPPPAGALATEPSAMPESPGDAAAPGPDTAASTRDDELVEPPQETPSSGAPEATSPAMSDVTEDAVPKRSRTGQLVILVVLILLAVWAYRHWIASTRGAPPPAAVSAIQRSSADPARSTPVARLVPGDAPKSPLASTASAALAAPAPARTAMASASATADATPVPAATTAMPPAATSTPAPATSTAVAQTASSNTLPASVGTVISARPVPAAAAPTAVPMH